MDRRLEQPPPPDSWPLDPRVVLATNVHAAPGVYAVLLGSGISSAAGIPTGWQVVQDLIRRIARAEGANQPDSDSQPESWWLSEGRPEPRFDTLLRSLGVTGRARATLLRDYFDPRTTPDGTVQPTQAHRSLARLVASGRIRVVVSTNFDHLLERALDDVGVAAQVITTASAVQGMIPLVHGSATVLKPNGDYAAPGLRITADELERYPAPWTRILRQVFDEYGLLVIGWSADYDVALAQALLGTASRRYPTFWTIRNGSMGTAARRVVAQRAAITIDTRGADDFLSDLEVRIRHLDQIATRRGRPTAIRLLRHPPAGMLATTGWEAYPLLWLRTAALLGPAAIDDVGTIRPEQRDQIVATLNDAGLTHELRELASRAPASAVVDRPVNAVSVGHWEPTPGGHQSGDHATYRLGGDATSGVSALARIDAPNTEIGGAVRILLDLGISLKEPLPLLDLARLFLGTLPLVTFGLPEAINAVLPADASPYEIELHLAAFADDGNQRNRPNRLVDRVDLSSLGSTNEEVRSMGFAARLPTQLTPALFVGLFLQAVDQMALDHGFLDPRVGLATLQRQVEDL